MSTTECDLDHGYYPARRSPKRYPLRLPPIVRVRCGVSGQVPRRASQSFEREVRVAVKRVLGVAVDYQFDGGARQTRLRVVGEAIYLAA